MTSKLVIDRLRSTLEDLESLELNSKLSSLSPAAEENAQVDPHILETYECTRDEYLRRRIVQSYLEQLETYDSDKFDAPEIPPERVSELDQRQRRVLAETQSSADLIQSYRNQLKLRFASFQTKKCHLERMVNEMEKDGSADDSDVEDVDEASMKEQEQELVFLKQRVAALRAEASATKSTIAPAEKRVVTAREEFESALTRAKELTNVASLRDFDELKKINAEISRQEAEWEDNASLYESLTNIIEELGGVRIISVSKGSDDRISFTVGISNEHQVKIGLERVVKKPVHNKNDMKVTSAELLTPSIVELSVLGNEQAVRLDIPRLSDLVGLADGLAPGENLRFVLHEACSRVNAIHRRAEDLLKLQSEAITKIGKIVPSNSFGGHDQEIVCTLEEERIAIVLRLTPDCPIVQDSVHIQQLVEIGGWDEAVVQSMMNELRSKQFQSPLQVVAALKEHVCGLVARGIKLPPTPSLPSRMGNN